MRVAMWPAWDTNHAAPWFLADHRLWLALEAWGLAAEEDQAHLLLLDPDCQSCQLVEDDSKMIR